MPFAIVLVSLGALALRRFTRVPLSSFPVLVVVFEAPPSASSSLKMQQRSHPQQRSDPRPFSLVRVPDLSVPPTFKPSNSIMNKIEG